MAEHPVTHVMYESRGNRDLRLVQSVLSLVGANIALDHLHQLTCDVKYAKAVDEARMRCARENEFRKPKLPNPAQPLERRRLDHTPERLLELISVELDQIMKRIPDPLGLNPGQILLPAISRRPVIQPDYSAANISLALAASAAIWAFKASRPANFFSGRMNSTSDTRRWRP
jgi:hypothetical protein